MISSNATDEPPCCAELQTTVVTNLLNLEKVNSNFLMMEQF